MAPPDGRRPSFEEYVASLGRLSVTADPTLLTREAEVLLAAGTSLSELDDVSRDHLATWVRAHPTWVPALGLAVGLSQEKLKNDLKHAFGTSGWVSLARSSPAELVAHLDAAYDLVALLRRQRTRTYGFGDLLVARGGTRTVAAAAGVAGRRVEDDIEAVALELGLPYETRTRFTGRNGRTAPCDLAVPDGSSAVLVVAAKGFDSTGSKLSDAVREVSEMAEVRRPQQYVMAVIDGIGWKSRTQDLRRLHELWESGQIDGMYTLQSLPDFRRDLAHAARLRGLLP